MRRSLFLSGIVVLVIQASFPVAAEKNVPPLAEPTGDTTILGTSEIRPSAWMAVISTKQGIRILVGAGEPIFVERDPHPIGIVQSVGPDDITLAPSRGGGVVRVVPGQTLPGAQQLVFRQPVLVDTEEFRHRVLGHGERKILDGELYLVELRGTRAILQRDVEPPSVARRQIPTGQPYTPTALLEQRLSTIKIVKAGPRTWEVNRKDIQTALQSGEAIISHALTESRVDFSSDRGIGLELKTPIADVRIDRRGFLITSPNLASRAGLEVGDRILGVNDAPVGGYGDLVRVYRRIKEDSSIRTVTLMIERDAKPLTLTYRIR